MTEHMLWLETNALSAMWNICAQISFSLQPVRTRTWLDAFWVTSVDYSHCDFNEEAEFSPLWSKASIKQTMVPLTKSEKSPKMNGILYFSQYCTGFHTSLFWSDQYHLGGSFLDCDFSTWSLARGTEHNHHHQTAVFFFTELF